MPVTACIHAKRGFSLIELLVVVAIIALLAAITLPGLTRAREYAYFSVCKSNLRQIVIGCTSFSVNNKGKLPGWNSTLCSGGDSGISGPHAGIRRIGYGPRTYVGGWHDISPRTWENRPDIKGGWAGHANTRWAVIVCDLYMGPIGSPSQNWLEDISGSTTGPWIGKPRRPGKYLPVDIFWDPIVIVRSWRPWGHKNQCPFTYYGYDGLETRGDITGAVVPDIPIGRDKLTRYFCLFGYDFFLTSVGCKAGVHDCTLPDWGTDWGAKAKYEQPYRYATKSKDITTSSKPSAWLASCLRPYASYDNFNRDFASHFGYPKVIPGEWRFNVVHLDGHVDDERWLEYLPQCDDWFFERYSDLNHDSVYGWRFKDVSGSNWKQGLEPIPGFPRPFDENR
jgi:prepilin-type N-terminal cleavage/methylation domain-containing protein